MMTFTHEMLAQASIRAATPLQTDKSLIYVVDDEAMIGEVVEVILSLEGYRPRFFQNPRHALDALQRGDDRPALMLTDFVMSPLNGIELIEAARGIYPSLKTVLYSGNVGQEALDRFATKPDAFLAKPFLPKTLITVIQRVLDAPDVGL
jgi:DNA-binding NtrC family response regulator